MKRGISTQTLFWLALLTIFLLGSPLFAGEIPRDDLNKFAGQMLSKGHRTIGYPANQNTDLKEFYQWYLESGLHNVVMNNVGNPRKNTPYSLHTHKFENEVIDFFAPFYGFDLQNVWGIVTFSGTDGNNHGIYFGVKYLLAKTKMRPVVYVSAEAHYSIKKLADLQNLEMKIIPTDKMGLMDIPEFEKALNPRKPALIVVAMGTTFKGAIDDQAAINAVVKRVNPPAVYRHLDAALFGGYLPFSVHKDVINRKKVAFDSIAVSGHKFFGLDEPMGLFITSKEVLDNQNPFNVSYLNDAVPTITCSRSALGALKFWWKVKKTGRAGYEKQAADILANARYIKDRLDEIGHPAWMNPYSNTIFFRRPSQWVMDKWDLAPDEDERLGGKLAHCIVMQHETREIIDEFISDIKKDRTKK
jgi:histidine decarboxylase